MGQVHCRVQETVQIPGLFYIVVELTDSYVTVLCDLEILKLYRDFCRISSP